MYFLEAYNSSSWYSALRFRSVSFPLYTDDLTLHWRHLCSDPLFSPLSLMCSLYTEDTYVQICLFSPLYTDELTLHWRHLGSEMSLFPLQTDVLTLYWNLFSDPLFAPLNFNDLTLHWRHLGSNMSLFPSPPSIFYDPLLGCLWKSVSQERNTSVVCRTSFLNFS